MTGHPFWHLTDTTSTQDALRERLRTEGFTHGASLLADRQTQGRGRQGREWQSLTGNYCGTFWLRTAEIPLAERIGLSYLAGLALHHIIEPLLPLADSLQLKWPNVLLLNGEKIAGVLIEAEGEGHLVGVGVNLRHSPESEYLLYPAAHLGHVCDHPPEPLELHRRLEVSLLALFAQWREEGSAWLFDQWQQQAQPVGTPIKVRQPDGTLLAGEMGGLATDGRLQLLHMDGATSLIAAGDIVPTIALEDL